MISRTLLFLISLFLASMTWSQPVMKDAIALRAFVKENSFNKTMAKFSSVEAEQQYYLQILMQYIDLEEGVALDQLIKDAFFGNPFISDQQGESIILLPNEYHSSEIGPDKMVIRPAPGAPSPGLFVTNFADGLARFLVGRAKQELTAAFFRDFQRKMAENTYLNALFPETAFLLQSVGEDIYQFNTYLQALRDHFVRDLKVLPSNLNLAIRQQDWLSGNPELQMLSADLLSLSQMLVDGQKPLDFIQFLGIDAELHHWADYQDSLSETARHRMQDISASLKTLELISSSLRTSYDDDNWLTRPELEEALADPWTIYIYLGLLWQKTGDITFGNGVQLRKGIKVLANSVGLVAQLRSEMLRFSQMAASFTQTAESAQFMTITDTSGSDLYYQYFDQLYTMVESGLEVGNALIPGLAQDTGVVQFMTDLRQLNYLQLNIRQKNYSLAVTNLIYILDRFLPETTFDQKARGIVLKYGMFMASVAESTSAQQVEAAIELFALPPGSSTLKKHAPFSFSLNAYTGIGYGREMLEQQGAGNTIAISAPVGLAVNFGLGKRRGSMSFFTSIIDVGAITAFRFDDSNTADLPALKWNNILAPGAYAIYGAGWDLPVSLGIGAQLGPNLRDVTNGQVTIVDRGWRIQGFIAVDIPIAHFYTKN